MRAHLARNARCHGGVDDRRLNRPRHRAEEEEHGDHDDDQVRRGRDGMSEVVPGLTIEREQLRNFVPTRARAAKHIGRARVRAQVIRACRQYLDERGAQLEFLGVSVANRLARSSETRSR